MIILKILGILIASISALIAIFGDTTNNGKLNKKGIILIILVALGLISSISVEILQKHNEEHTKKLEQEWDITEKQPIFNFEFNIAFREELNTQDFISLAKEISIKYTFSEPNDIGRYKVNTLKIIELDSSYILKDRYRLANIDLKENILGKSGTYFYPYYRDTEKPVILNNDSIMQNPSIVIGADKEKDSYYVIIGKSFTRNGWTYSSNRDMDWTSDTIQLCGFEANLPWKFVNTNMKLNSISDLADIAAITIKLPDHLIDLSKIDNLTFEFQTSDNQRLLCDLSKYLTDNKGENLISISGFELYNQLKEYFNYTGGRNVAQIEIR
ncbi:hypothetical protein ACFSSB_07225 [Lacinutrix gracilariae]|uniref:Uncharacterized protein n=1 Tax=Lacinutrix gracilariae TaxID=1747198 RepID=A0ABW5JZV5_9FLAO